MPCSGQTIHALSGMFDDYAEVIDSDSENEDNEFVFSLYSLVLLNEMVISEVLIFEILLSYLISINIYPNLSSTIDP